MNRKRYQSPECEVIMLNTASELLDEKFGNSDYTPTGGSTSIDTNYSNEGSIFDTSDYGEWENK